MSGQPAPEVFMGSPRLNTVDGEQRWQTPVYATKAEARISGSGWLYWVDLSDEDLLAWVRDRLSECGPIADPWVECEKADAASWVGTMLRLDDWQARSLCDRAAGWHVGPVPRADATRLGGIEISTSRTHATLVQDGAAKIQIPLDEAAWLAEKLTAWAIPALTDDQVIEHAKRYAAACEFVRAGQNAWSREAYVKASNAVMLGAPTDGPVISPDEIEALLVRVRSRMAEVDAGMLGARDEMVLAVAELTGLIHPSGLPLASARALCEAAGWPS